MRPQVGFLILVLVLAPAAAADDVRTLTVTTSRSLPKIDAVIVYEAGAVQPGNKKPKSLVTSTKLGEPVTLPGTGPYDVFVRPKGQAEVLATGKLDVKPGKPHDLKLADVFGTVQVFQNDESPRLGKIVITAPDDPGPDEKGHVAVQVGTEYREELVVPEGFYAVWVVPGNGARAQRIADRIRVLAGRTVRVGE